MAASVYQQIILSNLPENLNLVPRVTQHQTHIDIELIAGFPIGLVSEALKAKITENISQQITNIKTQITFTQNIQSHQTQLINQSLRNVKNIIAIASGKGGVGKSTVAVNLAVALAKAGARVGLLDADIYGPSVPTMLGEVAPVEIRDERYVPVQAHGLQAMSIGYLAKDDPALLWRGPMLAKSLIQMLDITQWDNLDYLFIDLPPGTGDIPLSLVQKIPLTGAIIVTTPQTVALKDAEKALKLFATTGIHVLGVVENMAYYHCPNCHHEDLIFNHKSSLNLDTPILGQLPLNGNIVANCDQGTPSSSFENPVQKCFMDIALQASLAIQNRPLHYASKFPPIIVQNT
jgi:ATP-binding protein involved in chromosome partitioning